MSRNYSEDQANEIEALDSIYCGDIEILLSEPLHKFQIPIATEEYNTEESSGLACKLLFTYTPKYPDEGPAVEIVETINFDDENYESALLDHLQKTIDENIGMEMIFTLVSSAQEWLNERWDDHKKQKEEEHARNLMVAEEAERKKFEGTRVTVETFMRWRKEFEESTGIAAKREKINECHKLTGRELFMRDNTLNDSDIKFLLEAGEPIENVKIDESLFQNIADLDLDDEDDDDPDWTAGDDD